MLQDELKLKEQNLTDAPYRSFTSTWIDGSGGTRGDQLAVYVEAQHSAACDLACDSGLRQQHIATT